MTDKSSEVSVKRKGQATESAAWPPVERAEHPLTNLRAEMDRLFEEFSSGFGLFPFGRRSFGLAPFRRYERSFGMASPAVDWTETDKEFELTAELSGLDENDLEVNVSDDVLTISGEKKEEAERTKADYHLTERRYGSFRRSFELPEGVDRDKIAAKFEKGVLTVAIPKSVAARKRTKKIDIKCA